MYNIETVAPAYKVGDRVVVTDRHTEGTIARIYPASGVPLYYGQRRVVHTHCCELATTYGSMWGLVDALLAPAPEGD